jgi:hypothetical protein
MKILISGSSGFIGSNLVRYLKEKGHEVIKLVRHSTALARDEIVWEPLQGVEKPALLEEIDAVIHLAGESIMGRWTESKKKKIHDSRVKATSLLCRDLCSLDRPPAVMIAASAVGYYGSRGDEILKEESSRGEGFLAKVCEEWEAASQRVEEKGIRRVLLRLGMVLSPKGGALKRMLPPFKWGLGGKLGDGRQWMSWIALTDLIRAIEFSLEDHQLAGPVNAVAPTPVVNKDFTKVLGRQLSRPAFMTVPAWAIKLILGELGREVLLSSQRVMPDKLLQAGFRFDMPSLEQALQADLSL